MAQTNKRLIADQVLYRLEGGYPQVSSAVQFEDIYKALEQLVNSMFKTQHFQINIQSGETIPENLLIAEYSGVVPTSYLQMTKSKAILPVIPISLPRNMGVYEIFVSAATNPQYISDVSFIPMQAGQSNLLRAQPLINDLLGQIGYSLYGKTVIFEKDITEIGITELTFRLIVLDISAYSETDILPIPSDYEAQIVYTLYKMFIPVTSDVGLVDPYAATNPQNVKQ